jgi:DNA-binding response OmpR family regulator
MDVEMPGMDGYQTTRLIREAGDHRFNPDIPIIAMTANAMTEDREKCLRSGMNDYITKPINPRELQTAIEKHLSIIADAVKGNHAAGCEEIKDAEIFNRRELLHRIGDDASALNEFVALFLKTGPEEVQKLTMSISEGDADESLLRSHSIKGMSANMHAERIRRTAEKIESAVKAGDLQTAASLLPELETRMSEFQTVAGQ